MTKRKPPQLSLFEGLALLVGPAAKARREREATEDSESARVVREELAEEPCLLGHSSAYICPACAECGDTDGCGFLHRQVCGGRIPLRACRGCGKLRTHGGWNHASYFYCVDCRPLGSCDSSAHTGALKKDHAGA